MKLADFSIARLLSGRSITTTDLYAFTPEHVAPEVLRHKPDGTWSDLYGLASTLATALLGVAPIRQLEGERVDAYLTRKMMAPAPRLPASVPRSIAEPIERALDPRPDRRPTVGEFAQAMATSAAQLGQGRPSQDAVAKPALPPTPAPGTRSTRRQRFGGTAEAGSDTEQRSPLRRWLLVLALCIGIWAIAVVSVVLLTSDGSGGGDSQTATPTTVATRTASTAPLATALVPAPVSSMSPTQTPPPTPAVTTAPVAASAPVSSVVEQVTVPPTTAAPAPTTQPVAAIAADEAERFVRTYYDEVNAGDYASSWASLTPEFQHGKARSYDYYVNFWDENDIEIGPIALIAADAAEATVRVDLRWNGSGPWLTDEFVLRRAPTGELSIATQTAVDR